LTSDEDNDENALSTPSSPAALTPDEDDDENTPSSPTALTSDEDDDENAPSLTSDEDDDENEDDEQDHKGVNGDECDSGQEQKQIHVQHGLPPDMHTSNSMLTNSSTFSLAPMIDGIATGRIVFGGSGSLINNNDLKSLQGHGKTSEGKWVSNFVIDRYLKLLKQAGVNVQMEVITWNKFEKGVRAEPAKQVLKGIDNQDLLLINK